MTTAEHARDAIAKFVEVTDAADVELVRAEAAAICDATAAETEPTGCDLAFGFAAEVAMSVSEAAPMLGVHSWWRVAAEVLRSGWKRGDQIRVHVTGTQVPS